MICFEKKVTLLYNGHLLIADTLSRSRWCPLQRGFTVCLDSSFEIMPEYNTNILPNEMVGGKRVISLYIARS